MKDAKKPPGRPKQSVTLDKKQEIRCTEEDKAQWAHAAAKKDQKVSAWAREVLNKEASKE
ncbi:hypothetical protein FCL42_14690 [Ferrimonas aestuarii]|uniref:Uncharacterized protein n=1 Tax=Ferrimonas aestuarii TaxID=2569539 RepID=A0A4U1BQG8_9GAMM|nr:hypothetical protein FCL42_14690 [Ferrimonas aestuarii]